MSARGAMRMVRMRVPAGKASPAPPVGPTLGQVGVNLMEFCKQFNAQTVNVKDGIELPVRVRAYADRTFDFEVTTPPTSFFLKRAAGVAKGATQPGKETVGSVTLKQVYAIAQIKHKDQRLQRCSLESVAKQVAGTARTIGLEVVR